VAWVADGTKQEQLRLENPDDFVRIEIEMALERGIAVMAVLVSRAVMPSEADLPASLQSLASRQAAEVRSGRGFHAHTDRLIKGIEEHLRFHASG
jgi:hypothetical protein